LGKYEPSGKQDDHQRASTITAKKIFLANEPAIPANSGVNRTISAAGRHSPRQPDLQRKKQATFDRVTRLYWV